MRRLSGLLICLFVISCNQVSKPEVTSVPLSPSRQPASLLAQATDEDPVHLGFSHMTDFISEGEINEPGENWIESVRDNYKKDQRLQILVKEAVENELIDEKLRHELESIQFDHNLDLLVKKNHRP